MRPADRRVSAGGTPEDSVRTAQPQGTHIAPIPAGRQRRLQPGRNPVAGLVQTLGHRQHPF